MTRKDFLLLSLLLLCISLLVAIVALTSVIYKDLENNNSDGGGSKPEKKIAVWPGPSPSLEGVYTRAGVAADNELCSEVGRNLMIKGGNVVDAILGTNICQGALNCESSGIGGGFFLTVYNKTSGSCYTVNAREKAPMAAAEDMYVNKSGASTAGYLAIGVPGVISGMWQVHSKFGALPWRELWFPTIEKLEEGFPVSGSLEEALVQHSSDLTAANGLDYLVNPSTGTHYKEGDVMKKTKLAATYRRLADSKDPVKLFYEDMAVDMSEQIRNGGGIITEEDFKNYSAEMAYGSDTVTVKLQSDMAACGPPPPSSAAVVIALLNIMDGYGYKPQPERSAEDQALLWHRFIESMKFSYAARSDLGDPGYVTKSPLVVKNITSPDWSELIRSLITNTSHPDSYYGGDFGKSDHGTSHMSAIDPDGNAAALTATVNLFFGAKRASKLFGLIFNDEMDDFSTPGVPNTFGIYPSPENFIKPGKRPQSSMSPMVIYNTKTNKPILTIGASGGVQIISAEAYVAGRILWLNDTVKQAVDAPRLHNQLIPNATQYEPGFPKALVQILQSTHKQLMRPDDAVEISSCQAVGSRDGKLLANSDYRKIGGAPAGY